ncbi:hypothetical protein pb186bvf_001209 [Paramecium bursaria]
MNIDQDIDSKRHRAKQEMKSLLAMLTVFAFMLLIFNSIYAFGWDYKILIIYLCLIQFTFMVQKLLGTRRQFITFYTLKCQFKLLFWDFRVNTCHNIFGMLFNYIDQLCLVYNWELQTININYLAYSLLVFQFLVLAITVLVSRTALDSDGLQQTQQIQEIVISYYTSFYKQSKVLEPYKLFLSHLNGQNKQHGLGCKPSQYYGLVWGHYLLNFEMFLAKTKQLRAITQQESYQVMGSLWINLLAIGFTFMPSTSLIAASLQLDYNIKQYSLGSLIFCIVFFLLQVLYVTRNKFILIHFYILQDFSNETEPQQAIQNNNVQKIRETIRVIHRASISKFPQFMTRLSSTYYVEVPIIREKQKSSNDLKQKGTPKKEDEDDLSKKFDQLISSPRIKMEASDTNMIEQSKRKKDNCLVCYEREPNMINMPCGHGGFCQDCCKELLIKSNLCMLCRKPVSHTLVVRSLQNRQSLVEVIGRIEQIMVGPQQ